MGVELILDQVPMREEGMTPYELMLSESQERMLMILRPGKEELAQKIFEKWELDFAVIGTLTDSGRMVLKMHGDVVADLPIDPLALASPEYDRPWVAKDDEPVLKSSDVAASNWADDLQKLVACPDLASRRWIYEQYDHMVMGDTIQRPGGDAGVVRVHGSNKGLAITTDCTPRYVKAGPKQGGRQAVAEAYRNITAVGGRPLAVTDNLNFGNPEKPEIMGQIVESLAGMGEACTALETPVVSGNVSLYNETNGQAILPTPAIGAVGVLDDIDTMATIALKEGDEALVVIGGSDSEAGAGWLGQSVYLREIHGREEGAPPPVDLAEERKNGDFVRTFITNGTVKTCHDISDGGLLIAVAEMAMSGGVGVALNLPETDLNARLFGEDQGRYVVAVSQENAQIIADAAKAANVLATPIGTIGGASVIINGVEGPAIADLKSAHDNWLGDYMSQ
jgi:phosphoribosylformylglycinamidine synthase